MKRVITYGTFDLLHKGHIRLLKRAKALGDHLTVCVSTDEFNAEKGKKAYTPYEDRKYILQAIKYVDEVIPETNWDQDYCEVIYLPRTEGISSTKIKQDLGMKTK